MAKPYDALDTLPYELSVIYLGLQNTSHCSGNALHIYFNTIQRHNTADKYLVDGGR